MESAKEMRHWLDKMNKLNESSNKQSFEIKEYSPKQEGWDYIKNNKQQIWNFLNVGYKKAGYEKFVGCDNSRSLLKNANLVRIAFYEKEWVAISVYTGYRGGFKCVGITATTNEKLRECGVNAVHHIIKNDVGSYELNYWAEASGSVEKIYEKYGGIKIPNQYAFGILLHPISKLSEDGFHYERIIKGETQEKIIYGFNNGETYQKVLSEYKQYIEDSIKAITSIQIDETIEKPSFGRLSKLQCAVAVVNFFVDQKWEGCYDFPFESLKELSKYVEVIKIAIDNNSVPENEREVAMMALENGTLILRTSSPMQAQAL